MNAGLRLILNQASQNNNQQMQQNQQAQQKKQVINGLARKCRQKNSGKFCSNCGEPKPAPAAAAKSNEVRRLR